MGGATRIWLISLGVAYGVAAPLAAQQRQAPPFDGFTPGRCAVAPSLVEWLSRRDDPDTTAYASHKDTLLRTSVDSLKLCDAVYRGMNEDRELLNLARVKLAIGDDAQAVMARQRYLATLVSRSPREQAWAYYLIASDNLEAKPARMTGAQEMLVKIDQFPLVEIWRASMLAHISVASAAKRLGDEPLAKAEASVAIAKFRQLTEEQQLKLAVPVARMFLLKAEQALRLVGILQARAVIDTARTIIPSKQRPAYSLVMKTAQLYETLGKSAPPIDAQFWFRASDATPRPARGRVTFVSTAPHWCLEGCHDRYRALGRYMTRFGGHGLDVINYTQTWGFYADTAPASPSAEARYDSLYFLGHWKLPGMLSVAETRYFRLPDGRRRNDATPQINHYPNFSMILIDRRGIVRYVVLDWDPLLEEPLAQFVERLLAEPPSGTSEP